MPNLTSFTSTTNKITDLTNALLAPNSGIQVVSGSESLKASAESAVNFYDGNLNLGIGAGLLLTSGYAPGTVNDSTGDGADNSGITGFDNGDADINAVVNTVFQTVSYDATTLELDFTADPNATSISFDIVFGSEEYPEWVDAFVDSAVVIVNGVNYALFNHDPNAPLSVISSNLAAGYFQDNADNHLSIQYDGVSQVLKIVAPINGNGALNHIKIGIADTGDHILDSGVFIANLSAGNIPGSGVVSNGGSGTGGDDQMTGSTKSEYFNADAGNDNVYAGGGDDIVVAGSGNDAVYGGSGADEMEGDAGDDYLDGGSETDTAIFSGNQSSYNISYDAFTGKTNIASTVDGIDTLFNVEQVKFKDGLFTLNNGVLTAVTSGAVTPTNITGTVSISGVVMAGNTLNAIVIDPNGVDPASVSYQWSTSIDGQNWSNAGNQASLTLGAEAAGLNVKLSATYTDLQGFNESLHSKVVTVAQTNTKISIEPMQLSAPAGAGVETPLTTLVKQAAQLGYSPTEASLLIKSAFGVDPSINLATYNFHAQLLANPSDAQAIAFGKIAGLIAMTASVSDPTGLNLTLAALTAGTQGKILDLTNAIDLGSAGLDSTAISFVNGLNIDMADANTFATMKLVWNDWAGQKDKLKPFLNHFESISVHLNQAPSGFAINQYSSLAGESINLSNLDLVAGFTDPDGDPLSATNLTVDQGGTFSQNTDGTWTFTSSADFSGPVELSYTITDGKAGISASSMIVVQPSSSTTPINHAPIGIATALLVDGMEDFAYTVFASDLLMGFSDQDGDGLSVSNLAASNGLVTDNGDGTYTINPSLNFNGTVNLSYDVTDGNGGTVLGSLSYLIKAVNDTPTGGVSLNGTAQQGQILTASNTLADADGLGTIGYQWFSNGIVINGATNSTYTLTQSNVGKVLTVKASYLDGSGTTEVITSNSTSAVANVNDAPTGQVSITGNAQQGQTLTASNSLGDQDGLGIIAYQWYAAGVAISGATGSSYGLTANEIGKMITVTASYVDGFGASESVSSISTASVTAMTGITLTGTTKADTLTGTNADDTLNGLGSNDTLNGASGNDILNGGAGTDKMNGGEGSDLYLINLSSEHTTAEMADTGLTGLDEVRFASTTASTLTLYAGDSGIERVVIGTGINATADSSATTALNVNVSALTKGLTVIGNAGANTLTGSAFADVLDGGIGIDKLLGGSGNDTYIVDITATGAIQDTVTESGTDTGDTLVLRGSSTNTTATILALATTLENLDITATSASLLNLTGNASVNTLLGNAAANIINGMAGNDWLFGGAGKDTMDGGLGNDVFAYSASIQSDRATTDVIQNVDFGGLDALSAVDRLHFDGLTLTKATLLNNVSTNAMNTLTVLKTTLSFMSSGEAVLMNVTSGVGIGTYLFVDANGTAGYQETGDYAIQLTGVTNLGNFDLSDVTA